jgi:histone arginine demethylase JMJD6
VKILPNGIDRHDWATLGQEAFRSEYLSPLRPVILSGAIDHWAAMGKWTPDVFRQHYESRVVTIDGQCWLLGELLNLIELSTLEQPAHAGLHAAELA